MDQTFRHSCVQDQREIYDYIYVYVYALLQTCIHDTAMLYTAMHFLTMAQLNVITATKRDAHIYIDVISFYQVVRNITKQRH